MDSRFCKRRGREICARILGGAGIGFCVAIGRGRAAAPPFVSNRGGLPADHADSRVTVVCGSAEMGQGV